MPCKYPRKKVSLSENSTVIDIGNNDQAINKRSSCGA